MDAKKKERIIKKYLELISRPHTPIPQIIVKKFPCYASMSQALDQLEEHYGQFIDFSNVETDAKEQRRLFEILSSGVSYSGGLVSSIKSINIPAVLAKAEDSQVIEALPKADYYHRSTSEDSKTQNETLGPLINASRAKLVLLLEDKTKNTQFDPAKKSDVDKLIKRLTEEKKQAEKNNNKAQADLLDKYLTVAKDLQKINQLQAISIPDEKGNLVTYCSLAEEAGGVTEKVSLVGLDTVTTQLTRLNTANIDSMNDYIDNHNDYKLRTEAILKLPKHGSIEEVQRESMALNVSRILGQATTQSSIVSHGGVPALFIPFDNIKLMSEFAKGQEFKAFGSSKTYEHYSTINPVGAGLQGDTYIDDFGGSLGLFYLCSDTDSMGGYNQNKALRDNKSLYIFDQVIMSKNKMKLDSRLSLQPSEFIMKHTRHGQGRNRSIIEDSSLDKKFDSLMLLVDRHKRIMRYARSVENAHNREIDNLNKLLRSKNLTSGERKALESQKKQVTALREDAVKITKAMHERINTVLEVLPKIKIGQSDRIKRPHIKQALVLEKLLHNPTLFTKEGRPYKNPWTYRQDNPVKTVEFLENGKVLLKFDKKVPKEMIEFIKRQGGGDSIETPNKKSIAISEQDLLALKETLLHPESSTRLQSGVNYLDPKDLKEISKAYNVGHRGRILRLIQRYNAIMNDPKRTQEEKLLAIRNIGPLLKFHINDAKDKGFGQHVLKKVQFDIQQRLQAMMPGNKPDELNQAFEAALKLDQVELFNRVVAKAVEKNKVNDPNFIKFLQDCIREEANVTNHAQAKTASQNIAGMADNLINKEWPRVIVIHDMAELDAHDVDPISIREAELEGEREKLIRKPITVPEPEGQKLAVDDGPKVKQTIEVKI